MTHEEQMEDMYERVRQLEAEVHYWKSQITSSNEHLSRANELTRRLEAHVHVVDQDNKDMKKKLNRYRRLADRYANEQMELKSKLAKERKRAENAESRLEASAERVATLHGELKAEQDRHVQETIKYEETSNSAELLRAMLRDARNELDEAQVECARWIKRNNHLEEQLSQIRAIVK